VSTGFYVARTIPEERFPWLDTLAEGKNYYTGENAVYFIGTSPRINRERIAQKSAQESALQAYTQYIRENRDISRSGKSISTRGLRPEQVFTEIYTDDTHTAYVVYMLMKADRAVVDSLLVGKTEEKQAEEEK
jgi:hypothetical protein